MTMMYKYGIKGKEIQFIQRNYNKFLIILNQQIKKLF